MKTELEVDSKHGKWTVLGFDCVDQKRRRRYNCRCECGIEKSVIASAIAAGRSTSCVRCKAEDLTDREFGLWKVLKRSDEVSHATKSRTLWICRCSCGAERSVERCNLIRGCSEGCFKCRNDVIDANRFPKIWYRKLLEQAKERNHPFEFTEEELWELWESQKGICPLTGMEIEIAGFKHKKTTASLDRIRNDQGYVKGNVWFIHKHANMMKHVYDLDYFIEMCCKIASNARKRY